MTGKTNVQQIVSEIGALVGTDGDDETSTGESVLNLRNLGENRTLTLINGKRVVGGFAGTSAVDVNVIPVALIKRVDVLTGGASAIYGADAVTGVVNFILNESFEGLEFNGYFGDSIEGDFRDQSYSVTAGKNFSEGRGNIAVNYTYGERALVHAMARQESSSGKYEQIFNQNATGPTYVLAQGVREAIFSERGAFIDPGFVFSTGGFNGDGSPFEHGVNVGSFSGAGEIGGDGLSNWKLFAEDIRPGNERHVLTILGYYDVSEAFRPYTQLHYSDIDTRSLGQESATMFLPVSPDNAFLPDSVRAIAPASMPVMISRFDLDNGDFDHRVNKETSRIVAGARGQLSR